VFAATRPDDGDGLHGDQHQQGNDELQRLPATGRLPHVHVGAPAPAVHAAVRRPPRAAAEHPLQH